MTNDSTSPPKVEPKVTDEDFPHDHDQETMDTSIRFGALLGHFMHEKFNEVRNIILEVTRMTGEDSDDHKSMICPSATLVTALEKFIAVELALSSGPGQELEAVDRMFKSVRHTIEEILKNPELAKHKANVEMATMVEEMRRKGKNTTAGVSEKLQ